MKIWITPDALRAKQDDLLWSGALYGLKRLQQLDHRLAFENQSLSDQQSSLLENEQIQPDTFSKDDADLVVTVENGQLACYNQEQMHHRSGDWITLSNTICFPTRKASRERKTAETTISITLNLDGSGQSDIDTGLGFFDHMLEQIAKHGLIDLELYCEGDLNVDEHHTIEDVAITLGKTIDEALGNKVGIERYGFTLPMDETLAEVALDLSGRPYLVFDGNFDREYVGDMPTEMIKHFFYSLAINMEATLHVSVSGENDHHKVEGCFKSFARCLRAAISRSERNINVLPSTKDLL
jgi:imidazoleglycerol-phosphate dehydratase/histidinol-phosphatase